MSAATAGEPRRSDVSQCLQGSAHCASCARSCAANAHGNTLYYAVVGDAAKSSELLVLFNGTGGILPDWPVQMLTNSRYSPRIAHTLAYSAAEDGPISLCTTIAWCCSTIPASAGAR